MLSFFLKRKDFLQWQLTLRFLLYNMQVPNFFVIGNELLNSIHFVLSLVQSNLWNYLSIDQLRSHHSIPGFIKDNKPGISQFEFIELLSVRLQEFIRENYTKTVICTA